MTNKGIYQKHGETVIITDELIESSGNRALMVAPGEDVEVSNYYEQAVKLQSYAKSRIIKTFEDIKIATDDLAIISRLKKAMEEKRKEYLKPLQESVKAINDNYKFWMQPIEAADSVTREKILAFNKEQDHIRQEQEGVCPFLLCFKTEPHNHKVCPKCGAVRYGNPFCDECKKQRSILPLEEL